MISIWWFADHRVYCSRLVDLEVSIRVGEGVSDNNIYVVVRDGGRKFTKVVHV